MGLKCGRPASNECEEISFNVIYQEKLDMSEVFIVFVFLIDLTSDF